MAYDYKLSTAELLFRCASQMGLRPTWMDVGSIFAVTTPWGEQYIHYAKSSINPQLSSSLTGNKVATRLVLERGGLPGIPFLAPANVAEALTFLETYKKIIVKPIHGSNSHNVRIVESPQQLTAVPLDGYIFEQHVAGKEMRYLVLNDEVIGVHESRYGQSVAEDRPLERISYPAAEWDTALELLSLRVAKVFGLRYAAVDYLVNPHTGAHILEVNSSPGMKWFHAPTSGPVVDIARLFLTAMLDDMRSKTPLTPDLLVTSPREAYS